LSKEEFALILELFRNTPASSVSVNFWSLEEVKAIISSFPLLGEIILTSRPAGLVAKEWSCAKEMCNARGIQLGRQWNNQLSPCGWVGSSIAYVRDRDQLYKSVASGW
jgi:hypothetical protein